jgi:hypothetical protein
LFADFKPDVVHSFNGSFEEIRPIFDICKAKGIRVLLYEGFKKNNQWQKVIFDNHLPHDIKYLDERRNYVWDHLNLSLEEKIELGKSFYEKRRQGEYSGDRIYVKDQIKGKVPPIDDSKVNIAIMNSSEDEFASVGAEWETLKLFSTQLESIVYLLEHADAQVHFYLRIHPNLKDVRYKYHTDLLLLGDRYKNITVIPGDSDVSTYSLLDSVDKIICFGSTIGIESVYWRKPSILLRPSLYYYANICYVPKNKEELLSLLIEKLEPKFNDFVYKYGAQVMNNDPLIIPQKNINYYSENLFVAGHPVPLNYFENVFLSPTITAYYLAIGRLIRSNRIFCKYVIPIKEG